MRNRLLILLLLFSMLGLLDSTYLTYIHYNISGNNFCALAGNFECNVVSQSTYSEITGILSLFGIRLIIPLPVSVMGIIYFLIMFVIIISIHLKKPIFNIRISKKELKQYAFILSLCGMAFGLFLIYVQAFVLKAWCLFCLILDLILFSMLIIISVIRKQK